MRSTFTRDARRHGGNRGPFAGLKRVLALNALAAIVRASRALRALTTAKPWCELASQFGSRRSKGVNFHIGIGSFLQTTLPSEQWQISSNSRSRAGGNLMQAKISFADRGRMSLIQVKVEPSETRHAATRCSFSMRKQRWRSGEMEAT